MKRIEIFVWNTKENETKKSLIDHEEKNRTEFVVWSVEIIFKSIGKGGSKEEALIATGLGLEDLINNQVWWAIFRALPTNNRIRELVTPFCLFRLEFEIRGFGAE